MRRRFFAFLTLIISALVLLVGNFANVYTRTKGGMEFENGKQFVYKISSNDEDATPVDIEKAASEMNRRLKNAKVNYYDIHTEGDDQIRVTIAGNNSSEEEHIKKLLSYNATFTLAPTDDSNALSGDEIFNGSVARIEYRNEYPIIIIPITGATEKVENMRKHASEITSPTGDTSSDTSSDTSIDYTMIVLWANKVEGDDFANAMDPNNPDYKKMQEKVLLAFSSTEENFYYNGNHNEIFYVVGVGSNDSQTAPTKNEVRQAAIEAQQKVDLFNAGSLDYDVEFMYELDSGAYIEELIHAGDNLFINWNSKVLICFVAAFVIVAIILAAYYRICSPVSIVTIFASLLMSLFMFNVFGVEFSIGAILGLTITALLGIFSSVIYFENLKNELYKGRTLKKANSEASKHTTLPIIDASVVTLLASLITYFIGEPLVKPFAVMTTIGAVCNLVFSLLGTKLLMWLLTNDTFMQTHKRYFGVDESKIPNTANEEKQTYFGPYDGKNFTKKSSRIGIVAGLIAVIGVACTIAFNYTIGTFHYEDSRVGTRIQLVVDDRSEIKDVETLANDLTNAGFKIKALDSAKETDSNDENVTLNYFIVDIKSFPSSDSEVFNEPIYDDNNELDQNATVQNYFEKFYQAKDSTAEVKVLSIMSTTRVLNVWKVALAALFGILLSAVYIALRYGISKALSSVLISVLTTFLSLAFFIICRITFNDMAGLALLGIMDISLLSSIFVFHKEKEMRLENKEEENEKNILNKAIASAFGSMTIFHSITILTVVLFVALGPSGYEISFALLALGSIVALLMNTTLLGPTFSAIRNMFKKMATSHPKKDNSKKKKKTSKAAPKSSEPEEAIFIGIND